jgi:lipopolysaccharide transport system ATP-binding protein
VSFEVPHGAVVGVIGRNGAGKSTLLKVLSRITEPTEGQVRIHGRVSSLLEVGTGFHPELTGRENVFLNGAILGMKRAEIVKKFDEIVAFAELETFIDTPVKYFSSGMYVRLAFAVAAHLEPEILLVDEVLAVGDTQFQKKCLGKIGEVATNGRTVMFISHNMAAISRLCTSAIRFAAGQLVDAGSVRAVVAGYLRDGPRAPAIQTWPDPEKAPGNDAVRLQQVSVLAADRHSGRVTLDTSIDISVSYWNCSHPSQLSLNLVLFNSEGVCVLSTISPPTTRSLGLIRETCHIPGGLLNSGEYDFRLRVVRDAETPVLDVPNVGSFEVLEVHRPSNWWQGEWMGVVRPTLTWSSELTQDEDRQALAVS